MLTDLKAEYAQCACGYDAFYDKPERGQDTAVLGNTYQRRRLADGREFEVIKNVTDEAQFRRAVAQQGSSVFFKSFEYFGCAGYEVSR